jgi:hypothetical protein
VGCINEAGGHIELKVEAAVEAGVVVLMLLYNVAHATHRFLTTDELDADSMARISNQPRPASTALAILGCALRVVLACSLKAVLGRSSSRVLVTEDPPSAREGGLVESDGVGGAAG